MASQDTKSSLVIAAEELVKAACVHIETASATLTKDTLESLKELTLKSSQATEKSIESMNDTIIDKMDSVRKSLTWNMEQVESSVKQLDDKLNTLNHNMVNLKDELANLNKTLEKQSITHKLEWAVANFDKISEPFTFYSYKYSGKSCDFTKCSSSALLKQILLAFLRGEGCDINFRTLSRQNKEDGEKQFREAISKEVQAIMGQRPRIEASGMIYSS
jgi:hypothetical protein